MKRYTLLIALICNFLFVPLFAQQYVPFPDSNVVWKIYWMPYPPDVPWSAQHYDYITSGDTIINDIQYTQLYKVEYDLYCSDIADTSYIGAYRNDVPNKIVYFYQGSEEKILYNFSLALGDTIPTSYFIETDGTEMLVCDIDSIQLENGEYRKQFTYEFPNQGETCLYEVVEGIGFLGGPLEPMSIAPQLFLNSILVCYHNNDSLFYVNPWWEVWGWNECEIEEDTCIVSIIEKPQHLNNIIEIVPNPVSTSTTISFELNQIQTFNNYLWIFDLYGKEIASFEFHDNFFTIKSPANKGVYIIRIFVNNRYYTFKLIVSN